METDSRSTRGLLFGADSRTTWGLVWEGAETLTNIITGVPRSVHSPALAWKVVQAAFVQRVVHLVIAPKVVNAPFVPRLVAGGSVSKAVHFTSTARVSHKDRIPRIQVPPGSPAKAAPGVTIPKVQTGGQTAKAIRQEQAGKTVKTP